MAKQLEEWIETDVELVRGRSQRWLGEQFFFRDPARAVVTDPGYFFSPADGVVLYQRRVSPDEPLVELKGRNFTLREAMREPDYAHESLVIGIFMTYYDVHVNRVPYGGRVCYRELDPLDTYNYPMLSVELELLDELRVDLG